MIGRKESGIICEIQAHNENVNFVTSFQYKGINVVTSVGADNLIKVWDYVKQKVK